MGLSIVIDKIGIIFQNEMTAIEPLFNNGKGLHKMNDHHQLCYNVGGCRHQIVIFVQVVNYAAPCPIPLTDPPF